jgi:fibronectin type III domain protein
MTRVVRSILGILLVAGIVGCGSGGDTSIANTPGEGGNEIAGRGSGGDTPAADTPGEGGNEIAGHESGGDTPAADTAAKRESRTLSWDAVPDSSVLGYKVYWGTSSHHYDTHVVAGGNTSYTVTGLRHGKKYFFAVSAYNVAGESGLSGEVSTLVD